MVQSIWVGQQNPVIEFDSILLMRVFAWSRGWHTIVLVALSKIWYKKNDYLHQEMSEAW